MPYIDKEKRAIFDDVISEINRKLKLYDDDEIEGILNYIITNILCGIKTDNDWRYRYINRAIGVLECVKLEFYRRIATNYEEHQMGTNGDLGVFCNKF